MATLSLGENSQAIIQSQLNSTPTDTDTLKLPKRFTEEPSTVRKVQYGADMETNLVGDIWRLGESTWESLSPDVEHERLDWLYEKYPEFAS